MKPLAKQLGLTVAHFFAVAAVIAVVFLGMKMAYHRNQPQPAGVGSNGGSEYVKAQFTCRHGQEANGLTAKLVNPLLAKEGFEQLPSSGVMVCMSDAAERSLMALMGTADAAHEVQALVTTSDCTATACNNAVVALVTLSENGNSIRVLAKYPTSEMYGSGVLGAVKEWTSRSVTFARNGMLPDGGCDETALKSMDFVTQTITIDLATGKQHIDETCSQRSCTDTALVCK